MANLALLFSIIMLAIAVCLVMDYLLKRGWFEESHSKFISSGLLCRNCGCWMSDVFVDPYKSYSNINRVIFNNPPGHPRTCSSCSLKEK